MKVIGVKYCGGCNPEIHRQELVDDLTRLFSEDCSLETGEPSEPWDIAILVCGCPVACLDRPETRALARNSILVSGSMVDLRPVPMERLATVVAEKLQELASCGKGESS
jgi:hypothetical protein